MPRSTLLVVVLVGVALVVIAFAAGAERIAGRSASPGSSQQATPQVAPLDWHEAQGKKGERLEFEVDGFRVLRNGWRAQVGVKNDSQVAFGLDEARRTFGLMLFTSGVHDDLQQRVARNSVPSLRPALRYEPELPKVLEPKGSWRGTMSARGALVAGSWVRFVFGTFDAIGRTPDAFADHMVWITDHAYRLRG